MRDRSWTQIYTPSSKIKTPITAPRNDVLSLVRHHGKLLDLSLPLRYSGVPNNGKLELVPVDKPRSDGELRGRH